jgi:hypothetical protein
MLRAARGTMLPRPGRRVPREQAFEPAIELAATASDKRFLVARGPAHRAPMCLHLGESWMRRPCSSRLHLLAVDLVDRAFVGPEDLGRAADGSRSARRTAPGARPCRARPRPGTGALPYPLTHAGCLATVWPQPCEDGDIRRRASADDRWLLSRKNATSAYVHGRPRTLADGLIIRRSQVQVLPAPQPFPLVSRYVAMLTTPAVSARVRTESAGVRILSPSMALESASSWSGNRCP